MTIAGALNTAKTFAEQTGLHLLENCEMTFKNITFALGLTWLVYGGLTYHIIDWDVPVSLIMAGFTYASADWVVDVVWRRQYRQWPMAAFLTWVSVAGSYNAYWILTGHRERLVPDQWLASLCLFLLCGVIWSVLPKRPADLGPFLAEMAVTLRLRKGS